MTATENSLIRYLRETNGTLTGLAAKIGRSPSTLTRAVNGERNPSINLARDIERATGGAVTASAFIALCMDAQPAVSAA